MKYQNLCAGLFIVLFCLASVRVVEAADVYSRLTYLNGNVYGYSETSLTYDEAYYYEAAVDGFIYDQSGNALKDYAAGVGGRVAVAHTQASTEPGHLYDLFSDHYAYAFFYRCYTSTVEVIDCDPWDREYYDPFGFSNYPDYGYYVGAYRFYGYVECYVTFDFVYLGTTGSVAYAPDPQCPNTTLELRAITEGIPPTGVLNGTSRAALLGNTVKFEMKPIINGRVSYDGDISWTIEGNHVRTETGEFDFLRTVYWRELGTYRVTAVFKPDGSSGCRVTATTNVDVVLPKVNSYTGTQDIEQVNYGRNCSGIGGNATFTLGCGGRTTGSVLGIKFDATVQAPRDLISNPQESEVRFVQLISVNRTRETARGVECLTPPGLQPGAVVLDGGDPYDTRPEPARQGVEMLTRQADGAYLASLATNDSPGSPLDIPLRYNRLTVNDQFVTYIKYSVPDLNADGGRRVDRVIGKLEWNWGGQVTFNPASNLYNLDYLNNPTRKVISGVATTEQMMAFGYPIGYEISESHWQPCGSSDPCDIDPSQCDPCTINPYQCDPCYSYGNCGMCDPSGICYY